MWSCKQSAVKTDSRVMRRDKEEKDCLSPNLIAHLMVSQRRHCMTCSCIATCVHIAQIMVSQKRHQMTCCCIATCFSSNSGCRRSNATNWWIASSAILAGDPQVTAINLSWRRIIATLKLMLLWMHLFMQVVISNHFWLEIIVEMLLWCYDCTFIAI